MKGLRATFEANSPFGGEPGACLGGICEASSERHHNDMTENKQQLEESLRGGKTCLVHLICLERNGCSHIERLMHERTCFLILDANFLLNTPCIYLATFVKTVNSVSTTSLEDHIHLCLRCHGIFRR